jgi:hypothetical protein
VRFMDGVAIVDDMLKSRKVVPIQTVASYVRCVCVVCGVAWRPVPACPASPHPHTHPSHRGVYPNPPPGESVPNEVFIKVLAGGPPPAWGPGRGLGGVWGGARAGARGARAGARGARAGARACELCARACAKIFSIENIS